MDKQPNPTEVNKCCSVFDRIFDRKNTERIMILMKYSLGLSAPWISKHYTTEHATENPILGTTSNFHKLWIIEHGDQLRKLFSKNDQQDLVHGWRQVFFKNLVGILCDWNNVNDNM